jgi:hypothetical protein
VEINSILYPNLTTLNGKFLAIQATSAPTKRVFSREPPDDNF